VFRRCRGRKTLEEILEDHPLARREVQALIAALLISELLEHHPEPQEGEELVEEEVAFIDAKLRHKILEDYRRIMETDYFSALGITQQSDTGEARRAYYRLAKEYHPDRFLGSGLSAEMSAKINEMFQYITQAYTVLSDPAARADYLEEMVHGPKHKVDINQVIEAEGAYQEGRALLKVRRFSAATRALKRAIELSPEEPEYLTDYAWALFKSGPEIPQFRTQALEILLTARELNPGSDRVHLSLGHIYLAEGKERQAEKAFEMAVQANPDCTEALRELRLINLRREQAAQGKGLFAGLLKKDKKDKKDK
jgi:tetratricopeptide (TPR) repeat protein